MASVLRSPSVRSFGVPRESLFVPKETLGPVRLGSPVKEIPEELEVEDGLFYFPPEWEEALEKMEAEMEKVEKQAKEEIAKAVEEKNISVTSILKMIEAW